MNMAPYYGIRQHLWVMQRFDVFVRVRIGFVGRYVNILLPRMVDSCMTKRME